MLKKILNDKKLMADIILVAVILIIALSALLITTITRKKANEDLEIEYVYVTVKVDNKIVAEYPLSEDGEFVLNGGTNILVIEDEKAYLRYSECPDQTCMYGKSVYGNKISVPGEVIVCSPNHLVVEIVDKSDGGDDGLI